MNEFEKNVQSKTDDVADSAIGFIGSFVFFAAMFTIAVVIKAVGSGFHSLHALIFPDGGCCCSLFLFDFLYTMGESSERFHCFCNTCKL
jgi:hypothetical protein